MAGRVFVSCGQRISPVNERQIAQNIMNRLKDRHNLDSYVAVQVQSLDDVMQIVNELRRCDYFLFVDFKRTPKDERDLPVSLFSHQELAVAYTVGFRQIIALKQEGVHLEGFLKHILANPAEFTDEDDLLCKISSLVSERRWVPEYSRNLEIEESGFGPVIEYSDHTGVSHERIFYLHVHNRRPDTAALHSVCILDSYQPVGGKRLECSDKAFLKWAGQRGYERIILPKSSASLDLFALRLGQPGLFLHSMRDTPRAPVISENGKYDLSFKLFAEGYEQLEFVVRVVLDWREPVPPQWTNTTTAALTEVKPAVYHR